MNTLDHIRNENIGTLTELTEISRDSAKFFGDVAAKVQDKSMRTLFNDISESRLRLVNAIAAKDIKSADVPLANSSSTLNVWRQHYTDISNRMGETSMAYLTDIDVSEQRLGKAYDNLVGDTSLPESVKKTVVGYLPMMHEQHRVIHDRAMAIKSAV